MLTDLRSDVQDRDAQMTVAAPARVTEIDSKLVDGVLHALATMARTSQRRQSDVHFALRRAGVAVSGAMQTAILRELQRAGMVSQMIPLGDGGLLLTVTQTGMMKAGLGG
jgi:hypothetical protein